jgi:uncharacterized protein YfdQ (DUF2303 family)
MANEQAKSIDATAVAEAAELGRQLAVAKQVPQKAQGVLDAAPYIVLRTADGTEVAQPMTATLPAPHRKTGTVKLLDAESFILYYGMHGNGMPVYATMRPARFIAILNDHTTMAAGWRDHRADFTVGHSIEWDTWNKSNGKKFETTDDFAMFLENNAPDIIDPAPATMLQMALNFRVNEAVAFSKALRLQDGHTDLVYQNLVTADAGKDAAGGRISIPEIFSISIPCWDGLNAKLYEVQARFRFRLANGKLTIWYELVRPQKILQQAFADLWAQIGAATGAPCLHGTPD